MCVCRPASSTWCPIQHLQHEQRTYMALKRLVFRNSIYATPRRMAITMQSLLFSQRRLQCKGAHHCAGCPPLSFPTAVCSAGCSFPHSLPHVCCRTTAEPPAGKTYKIPGRALSVRSEPCFHSLPSVLCTTQGTSSLPAGRRGLCGQMPHMQQDTGRSHLQAHTPVLLSKDYHQELCDILKGRFQLRHGR